jgi:sentrin-specific protease 1
LEGVCESSNQDELLCKLLSLFEVEKNNDVIQVALLDEINQLHSNFVIGLFHEHISSIFDSNKKFNNEFNPTMKGFCRIMLSEQELLCKQFESAFDGAGPLYGSMRAYISNLAKPPPPVYELFDDSDDDIVKEVTTAATTSRQRRFKQLKFNDFDLQFKEDEYESFIGIDVTEPTNYKKLLDRRLTMPENEYIDLFTEIVDCSTVQEEEQSIFEIIKDPDMFLGSNRLKIERKNFYRLMPGIWLDNTVIDRSIAMFTQHLKYCKAHNPNDNRSENIQIFYTSLIALVHFYKGLEGTYLPYKYCTWWYDHVTDLFSKQFLIYPINYENWHWFLIVAYLPERRIISYDSSGISHNDYLDIIERTLLDEAIAKNLTDIVNMESGTFKSPFTKEKCHDMPSQRNGYDCGVFMLMLINCLIDNIPIGCISQADMLHYRMTLAVDIIRQKMNYYYEIKEEKL